MRPEDLSISDFNYVLPPDRIAQFPLQERDQSKLLIYDEGNISEDTFASVSDYLPENSTLIFNDTKVIHARIIFKNHNDANIEVFLLEPVEPFHDMQLAVFHHGECTWRCLVGNVKKWREDFLSKKFKIGDEEGMLEVRMKGKIPVSAEATTGKEEDFLVQFRWAPEKFSFAKVLDAVGFVPLPPYIKRKTLTGDEDRYQTLYAVQDGSVAAPTAGLHFNEKIFEKLKQKNIHSEFVTLHVSAGTFLPVKAQYMSEHHMHAEQIVVRKETIQKLLDKPSSSSPLICVGTTSLRTIESLYWIGKKLSEGDESLSVSQWEPYESDDSSFTVHHSLFTILDFMEKKKLNQLIAETKLLIAPGYDFKFADGLITNFHLPGSTLLLLVAAFIGDDWRKVYEHALQNNFRFLSYGDGSLLWRKR